MYFNIKGAGSADDAVDSAEVDNLSMLQRKIKEMEIALEQCHGGAAVPKVSLPVPVPILDTLETLSQSDISSQTLSVPTLKGLLEKYNPSQV